MANELLAVDGVINNALTKDAALTALVGTRIYADMPPEGSTYPLVVFSFQSGIDKSAVGSAQRIFTKPRYLVKAITGRDPVTKSDMSYVPAAIIADRLDKLMEGLTGRITVNGVSYTVDGCSGLQPIRFPENDDGVMYRHVGRIYELFVYPLSGA